MQNIRVASVQFNHTPNDKADNLNTIRTFVQEAAAAQVELIVFPEMCITGYWHVRKLTRDEIDALAEPVPAGPSTQELIELSKAHNLTIGAGLIERAEDRTLYNTYVVAMPNGQTARHRIFLHCAGRHHLLFQCALDLGGILVCARPFFADPKERVRTFRMARSGTDVGASGRHTGWLFIGYVSRVLPQAQAQPALFRSLDGISGIFE